MHVIMHYTISSFHGLSCIPYNAAYDYKNTSTMHYIKALSVTRNESAGFRSEC